MSHEHFATTTRGLRRASPPMRLFEKAKRLGIWNPADIDLTQDRKDWLALSTQEQEVILHLTALFQAGEEAVTLDLLPLIEVIASEGRIEEELYLTSFLFEEAKHTDFFSRYLEEVAGGPQDLSRFHTDNYRSIFYSTLPAVLASLKQDPSPQAQIRASVTYNLIVEGVLAETGYHAFFSMLERNDIMPGMRQGIKLLKLDESRHIAYGVYLLSRLISTHDDSWDVLEEQMNSLLYPALGVISDIFASYEVMPFGLKEDDFIAYATDQFSRRFERIEKARHASLADIEQDTHTFLDEETRGN